MAQGATLIFIDPGIDCTGVAKFARREGTRTLADALGCLVYVHSIESAADTPLGERLATLGNRVALLDASEFHVEIPTRPGMYKRHKGLDVQMAKSITKLYMSIGAICGGLGASGHTPIASTAAGVPKEMRHGYLAQASTYAGIPLPVGPRGGKREDEWDAIWGGCQELLK